MTVQELIDQLIKVDDKSMQVTLLLDPKQDNKLRSLLLCAESVKKANEFEETFKKFNIKYQRFGQGAKFEINCWAISAYDNLNTTNV